MLFFPISHYYILLLISYICSKYSRLRCDGYNAKPMSAVFVVAMSVAK